MKMKRQRKMKFLILMLLATSGLFAQTNPLAIHLGCFASGDTISNSAIQQLKDFNIKLSVEGGQSKDYIILSYRMLVFTNGIPFFVHPNYNSIFDGGMMPPEGKQAMIGPNNKVPDRIIFDDIKVLFFAKGMEIPYIMMPDMVFYRSAKAGKKCEE